MFMEYTRTQMRKELILRKLKDKGFRITKQRLILLDIIPVSYTHLQGGNAQKGKDTGGQGGSSQAQK